VTRSEVVERSFGNPGNGMPDKVSLFRRGADPPKNELGMTGAFSSDAESSRFVSAGNDFFMTRIPNFFTSEFGIS
jgi:hypothetical protein